MNNKINTSLNPSIYNNINNNIPKPLQGNKEMNLSKTANFKFYLGKNKSLSQVLNKNNIKKYINKNTNNSNLPLFLTNNYYQANTVNTLIRNKNKLFIKQNNNPIINKYLRYIRKPIELSYLRPNLNKLKTDNFFNNLFSSVLALINNNNHMVSNLMLNDKSNNNKLNTLENKINKISTYINNNNINKTETINKLNKISTYINSINNNSNYINRLTYLGKFLNIPNWVYNSNYIKSKEVQNIIINKIEDFLINNINNNPNGLQIEENNLINFKNNKSPHVVNPFLLTRKNTIWNKRNNYIVNYSYVKSVVSSNNTASQFIDKPKNIFISNNSNINKNKVLKWENYINKKLVNWKYINESKSTNSIWYSSIYMSQYDNKSKFNTLYKSNKSIYKYYPVSLKNPHININYNNNNFYKQISNLNNENNSIYNNNYNKYYNIFNNGYKASGKWNNFDSNLNFKFNNNNNTYKNSNITSNKIELIINKNNLVNINYLININNNNNINNFKSFAGNENINKFKLIATKEKIKLDKYNYIKWFKKKNAYIIYRNIIKKKILNLNIKINNNEYNKTIKNLLKVLFKLKKKEKLIKYTNNNKTIFTMIKTSKKIINYNYLDINNYSYNNIFKNMNNKYLFNNHNNKIFKISNKNNVSMYNLYKGNNNKNIFSVNYWILLLYLKKNKEYIWSKKIIQFLKNKYLLNNHLIINKNMSINQKLEINNKYVLNKDNNNLILKIQKLQNIKVNNIIKYDFNDSSKESIILNNIKNLNFNNIIDVIKRKNWFAFKYILKSPKDKRKKKEWFNKFTSSYTDNTMGNIKNNNNINNNKFLDKREIRFLKRIKLKNKINNNIEKPFLNNINNNTVNSKFLNNKMFKGWEGKKQINSIYKFMASSFKAMNSLISYPNLIITPNKIKVKLYYYMLIPRVVKRRKKFVKILNNHFKQRDQKGLAMIYKNKKDLNSFLSYNFNEINKIRENSKLRINFNEKSNMIDINNNIDNVLKQKESLSNNNLYNNNLIKDNNIINTILNNRFKKYIPNNIEVLDKDVKRNNRLPNILNNIENKNKMNNNITNIINSKINNKKNHINIKLEDKKFISNYNINNTPITQPKPVLNKNNTLFLNSFLKKKMILHAPINENHNNNINNIINKNINNKEGINNNETIYNKNIIISKLRKYKYKNLILNQKNKMFRFNRKLNSNIKNIKLLNPSVLRRKFINRFKKFVFRRKRSKLKKANIKFSKKIKFNNRIKLLKLNYSSNNLLNIFKNKMNRICQILSYFFQKPVDLEIIRLHYPYDNTRILVNLIGYMINKKRVQYLIRKTIRNSRFDDHSRRMKKYNITNILLTRSLTDKLKNINNKSINYNMFINKNKIIKNSKSYHIKTNKVTNNNINNKYKINNLIRVINFNKINTINKFKWNENTFKSYRAWLENYNVLSLKKGIKTKEFKFFNEKYNNNIIDNNKERNGIVIKKINNSKPSKFKNFFKFTYYKVKVKGGWNKYKFFKNIIKKLVLNNNNNINYNNNTNEYIGKNKYIIINNKYKDYIKNKNNIINKKEINNKSIFIQNKLLLALGHKRKGWNKFKDFVKYNITNIPFENINNFKMNGGVKYYNKFILPNTNIIDNTNNINLEKPGFNILKKKEEYNTLPLMGNNNTVTRNLDYNKRIFNWDKGRGDTIPTFKTGMTFRAAGRFKTQRVIPRYTTYKKQLGRFSQGKVNFTEFAKYTNKSKRGTFTFTIHSCYNWY